MSSFNKLNGYDVEDKRLNSRISNCKYHFLKLDTIKGDIVLLQLENKNIISDLSAVTNSTLLTNYLFTHNISKIDGIIISHYHQDHVGGNNAEGFVGLIASQYVDSSCEVYLPTDPDYSRFIDDDTNVVSRIQTIKNAILNACELKGITVHYMQTNDEVIYNNTKLRFLNSDLDTFEDYYNITTDSNNNPTTHTNYNNFSMVTEVQNINNTLLLTGDIEFASEQNLAPYLKRPISIKKIEHHGVNHLSNKEYLLKSKSYYNICMQTAIFNDNAGRYESFAFNIANKNMILTTETNGTMVFKDDGYTIIPETTIIPEIFNKANGVAGNISVNDNVYKNLGEVSYRNYIKENDDLNDYTRTGDYLSQTTSITSSLSNVPFTNGAFKLTVEYILNEERLYQKIYRNIKNTEIYYRYYGAEGWSDWNLFTYNKYGQALRNSQIELSGSTDYIKIPFNYLSHGKNIELSEDGGLHALSNMLVLTGGFIIVTGVNVGDNINVAVFKNNDRIARFQVKANDSDVSIPVPQIMTSMSSEDTLYLYIRNSTSGSSTITVNNAFNIINVL